MRGWYDKIWNVNVFQSWDPSATYNYLHSSEVNSTLTSWGTWREVLGVNIPLTKRSVFVSLGSIEAKIGLTPASVKSFTILQTLYSTIK